MNAELLKNELRKISSSQRAERTKRFFKMGPGEYAEGDVFIGVSNPDVRKMAKQYPLKNLRELKVLLKSDIHEERMLSLFLILNQFQKEDQLGKNKLYQFYLENMKHINNWDLVDLSAPGIVGQYNFLTKQYDDLKNLIFSSKHWERRIGVVANLTLIKNNDCDFIYDFSPSLFNDPEDLMHKATGWMLREAGKKDLFRLEKFIVAHGVNMPRTMLRYAIEKFSEEKRTELLVVTRSKM